MYRKFTADYIFTGTALLPQGNVLVTKPDGTVVEIIAAENAGDGVEVLNGIISPGFINAHCHLELSHLKGFIPQHTGLVNFVFKIITERNADDELISEAINTAEASMLQNGIVAVGDICNTTNTIAQKQFKNLHYYNFIEATGFVPAAAQQRFNTSVEIFNHFKNAENKFCNISPHAPYSVSPQLFELINNFSANNLLTIHNQETPAEDDFFKTGTGDFLQLYKQLGIDISFYKPTGKSSLQSVLPFLNKQQQLLLVHDVTTTGEDIECVDMLLKNKQLSQVYYCLCPNANLYISNTLPNINHFIQPPSGFFPIAIGTDGVVNIVLGTDSLASNHQLSILEEMKTLQHYFPQLHITQLLQWATLNGAKALQMETMLGSFEVGKKPGIVLIEGVKNSTLGKNSFAKRVL